MELRETPQIVEPIDWNLTNRRANLARAADFSKYPVEVIREFPQSRLLVQAGNVGGQIGLVSKVTGQLEYYVHYEIDHHRVLGNCATQVKLWRSLYASVRGLAQIGFEEILLRRFDTVISDRQQTDRGREFWTVQMSHFAGHGTTVGFIDGEQLLVYDGVSPISDWIASQDGWGKDQKYRQRRFFISNIDRAVIEPNVIRMRRT